VSHSPFQSSNYQVVFETDFILNPPVHWRVKSVEGKNWNYAKNPFSTKFAAISHKLTETQEKFLFTALNFGVAYLRDDSFLFPFRKLLLCVLRVFAVRYFIQFLCNA